MDRSIPENWSWTADSPAANTAAEVTLAAVANYNLVVCVIWGYDGLPTDGRLIVTDGDNTITVPILERGPGKLELMQPFAGKPSNEVTITLAAGGHALADICRANPSQHIVRTLAGRAGEPVRGDRLSPLTRSGPSRTMPPT